MPTADPWQKWGLVYSTRDGYPVLSEQALWHLSGAHPATLERVGPDELYVHLDQPYRAVVVSAAYRLLVPAPGRPAPAGAAGAAAAA
jgi:hypothetical protein